MGLRSGDQIPAPTKGGLTTATIMVAFGTRPEAIKMVPVIHELRKHERLDTIVVNTGQHRDLVDPVMRAANIEVDYDLECGGPGLSLATLTERIISRVDDLLTELRGGPERRKKPRLFASVGKRINDKRYPSLLMVHGDTTTAFATATAGMSNRLPVIHVEAGLRSGNSREPFPEEFNRQLISRMASLHIAPTPLAAQSLVREGVDLRTVYVSGNTSVDAVLWASSRKVPYSTPELQAVDDHPGQVIVATAHRRENWGSGIKGIARGLAQILRSRPDVLLVVPMHPNPTVRDVIVNTLSPFPNALLTEPLDYLDFAKLLHRAEIAISDSGGVQEEAPSLGTPVLVTRDVSERPEGIEAGMLALVGTNPERISELALTLLSDRVAFAQMVSGRNPFGDGHAAERIASALDHLIFGGPDPQEFASGFDRVATLRGAGFDLAEVKATIGFVDKVLSEETAHT